MIERILLPQHLVNFQEHLLQEEKSRVTVEKYLRDVKVFFVFAGNKIINKEVTVAYKKSLEEKQYAIGTINSMLASLNSFLEYMCWNDCKVKHLKRQRQIYCSENKELTKNEYKRLLEAAKGKEQLYLLMQTICGTGIRISELKYFTVEALQRGEVSVQCKSKTRNVLIPKALVKVLLGYAKKKGIKAGAIFVTRSGNPLNRSNVWTQMKKLCEAAKVNPSKVFPHNLRKLFARTFYSIEKDIAKLADILGHGSIETTRIYIMTTGLEHRQKIERLGLIATNTT